MIFLSYSLQHEELGDNSQEIKEDLEDKDRLERQKKEIAFESGVKCISLLSYMTQHLKTIPLGVLHRLLIVHDIPLLFTKMLHESPWVKEVNGEKLKYSDGKWNKANGNDDFMKVSKTEGQVM
ncbi:zinc finger MYND domain-containing protein 10 [Caerostris extrusa]|uniref:Zinc finger MYND domain-containing protein 10 n=1 Tax=Caerostris extrusa TaxID=172846 RepID=A0AAV4QY25_CAEEX|nr:zinc finger MYND domain-containing protein 10 [Caerostris extrusa]